MSRQGEVGNAALFLLSDLGSAVTGENLHVDAGYHIVGMKAEDAPDIAVATRMALELKAGMTLYFSRHGETEANREQRFSGHRDTPLTAKGERPGPRGRRNTGARIGTAAFHRLRLKPASPRPHHHGNRRARRWACR